MQGRSKSARTAAHFSILDELLRLNDTAFIVAVYQWILRRDPDEEGIRHYLTCLMEGSAKAALIVEIYSSEEARRIGVRLACVDQLMTEFAREAKPPYAEPINETQTGLCRSANLIGEYASGSDHEIPIEGECESVNVPLPTNAGQSDPMTGPCTTDPYREWVSKFGSIDDATRMALRARSDRLLRKPLISIIMPVYNANTDWLKSAIESVQQQIYTRWELCIADDASPNSQVQSLLKEVATADSRIKVVFRQENGHISAASNSALALATGDYVALLDHDDLLSEDALFWVADTINRHPQCAIIYSDEDKINEKGERSDAYFKSDWNPDLFYSQNLISHLGIYETSLITEIGGFRPGLEGSQDYDLALRCIERISPSQVHHIPRVLYHWRIHDFSTARSINAKPYAITAAATALREHFLRKNVRAEVEVVGAGYRVRYELPPRSPLVSLVITGFDGSFSSFRCLGTLLEKTSFDPYEVVVVLRRECDADLFDRVQRFSAGGNVRIVQAPLLCDEWGLVHAAVEACDGEVIGLVHKETEIVESGWLTEMASHALRPEVGAVGARLWSLDGRLQHGGIVLGIGGAFGIAHKNVGKGNFGYRGRADLIQDFSALSGDCLLVRKALFDEFHGLAGKTLGNFRDIDFCLRLHLAGYRNIWTPYAELVTHKEPIDEFLLEGEARLEFDIDADYMRRRWLILMQNDPAYSPNLTLYQEDFGLAWPPRLDIMQYEN